MSLTYKIKSVLLASVLLLGSIVSGCKDDFTIEGIGDGEAMVACEVNFVPLVSALGSRSSGTAIKAIRTLDVLIYDSEQETLLKHYTEKDVKDWSYNVSGNSEMPAGDVTSSAGTNGQNPSYSDPVNAEGTSASASFTLPEPLEYGKYCIYVVANTNLSDVDLTDIKAVKAISLSWDYGTNDDPNSISVNDAMFGYFTGDKNTKNGADQFEAPPLIINKPKPSIHAWIKRAASKVTIAFDGSGLYDGVHVYIKSVTLKNIPKNCYLGEENSPKGEDSFYNPSENFLQAHLPEGQVQDNSAVANSRFYYNSSIDSIFNTVDEIENPGDDWKNNWMEVINSGGQNAKYGSDHSADADALYFYENNQGDYENKPTYDKRQYKSTVGTNITQPNQTDYRDAVPNGTYVEVEAYYDSQNPLGFSRGPIRYRFMLGKNVTYNYNAERNHHFKLTLGFRGWANEPDWHIEYDQPDPDLIVPETFRVSYVYNQSHTLPIRVKGLCTGIEMEIVKNYWAPCDDQGNIAAAGAVSTNDLNLPFAFRWSKSTFDEQLTVWGEAKRNCTGFLALQVENDANGVIPTNILDNYQFSERETAINALYDYYTNPALDQHKRTFNGSEEGNKADLTLGKHTDTPSGPANNYEVISNGANDFTLLVPVFTRNKSMINGTNYSGNNPFEEYDRYAEIKVTAHYRDKPDEVRTIKVFQTRRLVNPKGIWRRHTNETGEPFHVQLATKDIGASYSDNYVPLQSDDAWTAYIEETDGWDFFRLLSSGEGDTTKYVAYEKVLDEKTGKLEYKYQSSGRGTMIKGKTNTLVDFYVDFGEATGSAVSNCGIITVLYHNNNCVHKIMVRQGYNQPLPIMGTKPRWSSFSVFGATERQGSTTNNPQFDVELTLNPLALGSMIRRGRVTEAFLVSNNGGIGVSATDFSSFPTRLGAYKPVYYTDELALYGGGKKTWGTDVYPTNPPGVGFADERGTQVTDTNSVNYGREITPGKSMGKFHAQVGSNNFTYRVPTFDDFKTLDDAEYAYGVCYGGGASETQMDPDMAFGFIDPENDDEGTTMGMRGIFVYNPKNANQIFFPIGKYGIGRRRMFNISNSINGTNHPNTVGGVAGRSWIGTLWYGDTNSPFTINRNSTNSDPDTRAIEINNWYRPMAWNVCYQQGAIYWIDQWVALAKTGTGSACMGWDMNYYGFDFSPYTANNYRDACIIKLVVDE